MREHAHPDLQQHIVQQNGMWVLQHPFAMMPLFAVEMLESMQESLLRQIAQKSAQADQAKEAGNWSHYLVLHERPWRIEALAQLVTAGEIAGTQLADALRYVWTDSESIGHEEHNIQIILTALSEQGIQLIDEEAEDLLRAARDDKGGIRIYRGHGPTCAHGRCWTLRPEVAAWFARRHEQLWQADSAWVSEARIPHEAIAAVFTRRDEAEVVVADLSLLKGAETQSIEDFQQAHDLGQARPAGLEGF